MACVSSFGVRSPRPRFYQELDHCVYRFNVSHHKQKTPIHPMVYISQTDIAHCPNQEQSKVKCKISYLPDVC